MDNGSDRVADEDQLSQSSNIQEQEDSESCSQNVVHVENFDNTRIDNTTETEAGNENECETDAEPKRKLLPQRQNQYHKQSHCENGAASTSNLKRSTGSISFASTSTGIFSICASSQVSLNSSEEHDEPRAKKRTLNHNDHNEENEHESTRSISPFAGFFSCIICRDIPHTNIYQCRNGHLMCSACSTHFLAEHTMNNVTPRCPCCRVPISRCSLFRNIAVENALVLFPEKCPLCNEQFERNTFERHRNQECIERSSICKYISVGCNWQGPFRLLNEHEQNCKQSKKTVTEVMTQLDDHLIKIEEEHLPYRTLMELINISRCFCLDLESRLYYTDRHIHMAYFGTRTFTAFGHQWAVKIRINEQQQQQQQLQQQQQQMHENNATTFKLQLKTRPLETFRINFFILNGPFSNIKFKLQVYCYDFNFRRLDSDYFILPLIDSQESYRMLANRKINFRVFMFLKGAQ